MEKLSEINSLRGLLALYVLFYHTKVYSWYRESDLLNFFLNGRLAVDVFIIISGFVIFYLLKNKNEPYKPYITRRFFRIYPIYIVLFFASLIISPLALENALHLSVYDQSASDLFITHIGEWNSFKLTNIVSHLVMLHGVIPQIIVPNGSEAFLVPAWSISLEWQFYLLAPFMFYLTRRKLVIFVIIVIICLLVRPFVPGSKHGAFLLQHIEFFFYGIITFCIFERVYRNRYLTQLQFFALLLFSVYLVILNNLMAPLAWWLIFFSVLYFSDNDFQQKRLLIIFRSLFNNRIFQFLGKISYSLYLSHQLVIYIIQNLLFKLMADLSNLEHFLFLTVLTLITSILVSVIFYHLIEKPGISFGRKLAARFD